MSQDLKFTIGTDPEFILKRGGKSISAIPYVPGTKYAPEKLPSGGTIQRDNVAVEFATAPADSVESFVDYVRNSLKDTVAIIPEDCDLAADPSDCFDPAELQDPEACEFGCDPDFCAWQVRPNTKPRVKDKTFRSFGGHVHVGHEALIPMQSRIIMVRTMDALLGVVSTVLDHSEAAVARRKLYGKAGCHRPTEYGLEYRSLSNYWLKSPVTVMLIHSLTEDALKVFLDGNSMDLIEAIDAAKIQKTINTGDVATAEAIIAEHLVNHMSDKTKDLLAQARDLLATNVEMSTAWNLKDGE